MEKKPHTKNARDKAAVKRRSLAACCRFAVSFECPHCGDRCDWNDESGPQICGECCEEFEVPTIEHRWVVVLWSRPHAPDPYRWERLCGGGFSKREDAEKWAAENGGRVAREVMVPDPDNASGEGREGETPESN